MGQPYKVTRIRVLEDLAFSKRMRIKFGYLNFPDCTIRHGKAIVDPRVPMDVDAVTLDRLIRGLRSVVLRLKVRTLVAPWPYGPKQHMDHRLLNAAAVRVSEVTGTELLYLDDQPYSRRPVGNAQDPRGKVYSPRVVSLGPSDVKKKLDAMSIYRSQMIPGYFQAVRMAPPGSVNESDTETLWQPPEGTG